MSGVRNITVPWVPLDEFDWSFARSGPLPWNLTVWSLLAVFTALPIWTTVELTVWVLYTFERWRGIYFWSVLCTTWGVTLHAVGFILKFCVPQCNWILATVIAEIGWVGMVTGFSVVLWSRLHLVIASYPRILRVVLAMIIIDGFLFHVPTIVFQFLVSNAPTHVKFLPHMEIIERIQVMGFSVQETIISAIYVWGTLQILKLSLNSKAKNTLALLIIVQVIVVLADVLVIVLDYVEYFTLKAVIHSFVYAFKLQVEFVVLNEFKSMAKGGITGGNGSLGMGSRGFAAFNTNGLLDMPKTSENGRMHNNSGVTMVVSSGGTPPSSRSTRPDASATQTEHAEELDDAIEVQYLGRYGRAL
ncbi:hypothetical protein F4820DRAFT_303697 [Hypoxylon rubiginosum]|uniref:Uncharacterized protein n=1 Tax=Hypoxylon rubiginosum TaxID=110542 RepID=A0ACB9Z2R7_9PEZI|nr:hypothetical protein F4820DRAFT_303697 [Hypoxylon rubiginosum]